MGFSGLLYQLILENEIGRYSIRPMQSSKSCSGGCFPGSFVANHTIDVGNVLGMINQSRLVVSIILYFHPYLGK